MGIIKGHADSKYVTGIRQSTSKELGWDNILAERWVHAPGNFNDTNPHVTEVVVMLAGSIRVRRRGDGRLQNHVASPGTIWLCPAGIEEDLIKVDGSSFDAIHLFLPANLLNTTVLEEYDLDPDSVHIQYDGGFHDPLIEHIGRSIANELDNPSQGSNLTVDCLRTALSAYVIQKHSSVSQRIQTTRTLGALDTKRLRRVTSYIKEHISQKISLAQLATEAQLSPYHFSRAFKIATGFTPHAYVVQCRVEQAKCLIKQGNKTLEYISFVTGFSSQSQMTRVFNKVLGISPGRINN